MDEHKREFRPIQVELVTRIIGEGFEKGPQTSSSNI